MMHRIKPRTAIDKVPRNPRSNRAAIIRWSYLVGVLVLGGWLGDLFLGGFFYLRSEGLVLGEPAVVAAEFPVTVRELRVREGERVEAGDVAAVVTSQSVAETLAKLTADLGARQNRLSELRVRVQTIDSILGLAETRERIATEARKELESLLGRGLLSIDKRTAAVDSEFRSRQELESLKAERRVVEAELLTLKAAYADAEAAVRDLRGLYNDGKMQVPISGIVSRRAAEKGSVVRAGEPIVEVYGHQRYVLAYLPTGNLYTIVPGDRVEIKTGLRSVSGVVKRIEPYAAALPKEFQRNFSPVDRQQVMRVEFSEGNDVPPLFTKVQLRSAFEMPRWAANLWDKVSGWASGPGTDSTATGDLKPALP
jgi:multidrug resistance efflux pump